MSKTAIFTMDVEAFYEITCLRDKHIDKSIVMNDGITVFLDLLKKYDIKANLFLISSMVDLCKDQLLNAIKEGHKISLHGKNHQPINDIDNETFEHDIIESKKYIEKELNTSIKGYRAPCFSITKEKLSLINEMGFSYDSSYVDSKNTLFYTHIDLSNYHKENDYTYEKNGFKEFALTFDGKLPLCGGAYTRITPWFYLKSKLTSFFKKHDIFIFYVHPFELSTQKLPKVHNLSLQKKFYLTYNRKKYIQRIEKIILLLKKYDFEFKTFEDLL